MLKKCITSIIVAGIIISLVAINGVAGEKGKENLVYWSLEIGNYPQEIPWFYEKLKVFQKENPNVHIDFIEIPYETADAKMVAAFAGRTGAPDIFVGKTPYYAGGLHVAAPFPPDLERYCERSINPKIAEFVKYEGKFYAWPVETDLGMMLYVNEDMFKKAGLDPEKPPKTMDELVEYAKKLTIKDEAGRIRQGGFAVRYSGNPRGLADKWLPFLHAWNGRLYGPEGKKASGYLNSPEVVEALQFYGDLVHKYKVASITAKKPLEAFGGGFAAMFFREQWAVGWLRDNAPQINYKIYPLPSKVKYPGISLLFTQAEMAYKFSPHLNTVWEWMKFIYNEEIDMERAKLQGTLPVCMKNWEKPYITERPDYKVCKVILESPASPYYGDPYINEIAFRVGEAVAEVLFGKKTAKEALDSAAPGIDEILAKKFL